jgi:hypothetical protein
MTDQWYVARDRQRVGPYSMEQLRALVGQGQLAPTAMLLKEGEAKWVPASTVDGLFVAQVVPLPVAVPAESNVASVPTRTGAGRPRLKRNFDFRNYLPPWLSSGDVVLSPDCRTVIVGGKNGSVIRSQLDTKEIVKVYGPLSFLGSWTDTVRGMIGSVWASRFSILGQFKHLALSANGDYLIGATDDRVVLWNCESGEKIATLPRWETWWGLPKDVAISPDGKRAAWCGTCTDRPNATMETAPRGVRWFGAILQWSIPDGQPFSPIKGGVGVFNKIVYSPDSRFLMTVGDDNGEQRGDVDADEGEGEPTIQLFDAQDGHRLERFALFVGKWKPGSIVLGELPKPAFSPDGRFVIAGDSNLVGVWETGTRDQEQFRLLRDSSLLFDNVLMARQVRALQGHKNPVTALAFLPDGRYILSGDSGGKIILWDMETGEMVASEHQDEATRVRSIVCAPDGATAISCGYSKYSVWSLFPSRA